MERTVHEQVLEAIRSRGKILVALPVKPSPDAIASGQALAAVLTSVGKTATLASSNFQPHASLGFLPTRHEIRAGIDVNRKLVISVNLNQTKVESLSYGVEGDQLKINVTPRGGSFEATDVDATASDFDFDLIITLDVPSLASLGALFEANADFFYHTPIVNIDHHPANEGFGQINLVDLVATSSAEIVLELLKGLKPDLVDDAIATNLLTGIITKTRCFRTPSVTPKSLAAASELIEAGAKRDEIIRHLYQTHSLPTLKIWGRALARLKEAFQGQYVWTLLSRQDFEKSGTDERALFGVVDELIVNTPRARIVTLLYESAAGKAQALVSSTRQPQSLEFLRGLETTGPDDYASVSLPGGDLAAAEADLLGRVEAYFRKNGLIE